MFLSVIKNEYKTLFFPPKDSKEDKPSTKIINEYSLTEESKKQLDAFYNEDEDILLTKEVLCNAIRRYLTRYLIREKDLELNVKNNTRNFIKYFYIEDLWDNTINKKENENQKMKKLKKLKIRIFQLIKF